MQNIDTDTVSFNVENLWHVTEEQLISIILSFCVCILKQGKLQIRTLPALCTILLSYQLSQVHAHGILELI